MRLAASLLALLLFSAPAPAMVGNALQAGAEDGARHAVLIVSSRGSSCTGTAVGRDLVLTAAHCVLHGADYKIVEYDAARRPALKDVAQIVRHPQFSLASLNAQRATADVALLKLADPLPARLTLARLSAAPAPTQAGDRFIVAGYGVTVRGDGRSGGTLRAAELTATGRPGNLQLRLVDPETQNAAPGLGACTGDSGAPVFRRGGTGLELIGTVSWSTAPNNAAGCGGLTGVTPLALYRSWIIEAAGRLGSGLAD
jgi:secreted trypsin-like serine protease